MAKVINRALQLVGETRTVGTPVVRVLDYDKDTKVTRCSGATVPTDADAGYAKGCIFVQTDGGVGSTIYINEGTSASADFNAVGGGGSGGIAGTLNQTYENGRTIEVDSGAITVTDAQATAHTFDIDKTGTGSGDIFNIKFEDAATGRGMYFDMDEAVAANAIVIDSGGTSRTGADMVFTDDSLGTHIVLDVNSSGAGKSTALDWTDSYAGSNASIGALFTMGNSNGLSSEGVKIVRGTGARTAPAITITDASTGNASLVDIDLSGVYTGDVVNVGVGAAATTGAVINMDLNLGVAYMAMYIDFGAGTRTTDAIQVKADGNGNKGLLLVTESNTGSGHLMDVNVTGAGSGNVLDITYSAADTGDALSVVMADNVAGGALVITGAGTRTDNLVDIVTAEDGSVDGIVLIETSAVFTGNHLTLHSDAAATTGSLLHLDLDAGVAYKAITFDHAGARTVATMLATFDGTFGSGGGGTFLDANISMTGAGASPFIDVDLSDAYTGNILDVVVGAVLATGDVISVNLGATAVGSQALVIASGAMARTTALVSVTDAGTNSGGIMFDLNRTGINAAIMFDIDDTAATTGNIFDYATDSASTGTIFNVTMANAVGAKLGNFTLSGTRTVDAITITDSSAGAVDVFQYTGTSTSSGHIFNIDIGNGIFTGNVFDVSFATAASSGDVFKVVMGTNVAGSALFVTATGARTDDLIKIDDDSTGNSHIFDINLDGIYTGNVLDITFGTAAATGEAIMVAMGTNVAGRAIAITSAGTGATDEGNALDITHTGVLIAAADVVNITSSGAISSTSNVLAIDFSNGDAGSYGLYINALNDGEAIKVDAGTVVIDESITAATYIDGAGTLTATMLELNNVADISGRLVVAGATETAAPTTHDSRIILLDTLAGSVVTLPAATGSGAVYRCIVSVVATSNSHIIKVTGDDVMYGAIWLADADTAGTTTAFVTAADSDTVTLNRTTTGSVTIGEWVEFVDVAADKWAVRGCLTNSGNGGTPFSATV